MSPATSNRFLLAALLLAACDPPHQDRSTGAYALEHRDGDRKPDRRHHHREDCDDWGDRCDDDDDGAASAVIGPAGGQLRAGEVTVEVPPGALDAPISLAVAPAGRVSTPGLSPLTRVYRFLPEGLLFAKPVRVVFRLRRGVSTASVYWSRIGGNGFDSLGGTVVGRTVAAETPHFGLGFAGPAAATRTVVGSRVATYISATTRVSEPNPGAIAVEALVPDAAGNLVSFPATFGTGAAAGTFTIPGLPPGEVLIRAGSQYLLTDSAAPDLGFAAGGRRNPPPTLADPALATLLDVSLTGLDPWQEGDQLEMVGSENDDWEFNIEQTWAAMAPGDTAARFALDLAALQVGDNYVEGSKGDRVHFAQLSGAATASGVPYLRMSRFAQLAPFDTAPGSTTSVAAALQPMPPDRSIDLDYRAADFRAALVADGNPAMILDCPAGCSAAVLGQAGLASDGFYTANADLLFLQDATGASVRSGPMSYGSPAALGGTWGEIGFVSISARVENALPGLLPNLAANRTLINWVLDPAEMAAPTVLTPPLTLPVAVTVSSASGPLDLFAGGSGMGLTPTLSWSPPRVGTPDLYRVVVRRLGVSANGRRTTSTVVATLTTRHASLTLPPGILALGETYTFSVAATKGISPAAPLRTGLGVVQARTASGNFTP